MAASAGWAPVGWVALGGALGSVARYALAAAIQRASGLAFPAGTFAVNALGCLAIGALMAAFLARGGPSDAQRAFFVTGVLGGFTTFSAFGWDTWQLLQRGLALQALLNAVGQLALGLAAVWAGFAGARAVAG